MEEWAVGRLWAGARTAERPGSRASFQAEAHLDLALARTGLLAMTGQSEQPGSLLFVGKSVGLQEGNQVA